MAGKPYQSILTPHVNEIIVLRRKKPPVSYSRIAALLHEKYQITIGKVGIRDFVKRQARKVTKTCKYAWDVELPEANYQSATEAKAIENPTALPKQPAVTDEPKQTEEYKPKPFNMKFSETYNLTRLPPEEAAARRKRIEEKERERERAWKKK